MLNVSREAGLEEDECDFRIGRRIINNLHYADDATLTAENANYLEALSNRN